MTKSCNVYHKDRQFTDINVCCEEMENDLRLNRKDHPWLQACWEMLPHMRWQGDPQFRSEITHHVLKDDYRQHRQCPFCGAPINYYKQRTVELLVEEEDD